MAVRRWGKRCKPLPDPLCQRRSPHKAVGNIRPKPDPDPLHILKAHSKPKKLIQPVKHCRRICAAPGHSRRNGDLLLKSDLHAEALRAVFLKNGRCRFINQVVLPGRQLLFVRFQKNPRLLCLLEGQKIPDIHRLHDHFHFMIPVRTAPEHVQSQIDLGVSLSTDTVHLLSFLFCDVLRGNHYRKWQVNLSAPVTFPVKQCFVYIIHYIVFNYIQRNGVRQCL